MQVYTSVQSAYIPLAPIALYCLYASLSAGHTISLLILTVVFSVGLHEQAYYNMGVSVILSVVCMAHNTETYIQNIEKHITPFFLETAASTVKDMQIWFCFFEGVTLIVILVESFRKYQKYKNQAYQSLQTSW